MTPDTIAGIGHNKPPVHIELAEKYREKIAEADGLMLRADAVPAVIDNDTEGPAQDVYRGLRAVAKELGDSMKAEKKPFNEIIKQIGNFFTKKTEELDGKAGALLKKIDTYKEKKEAEERRRREDEARRLQEEADAKRREAEEAERRREEAERARLMEEERARKAQEERERAQREQREAEERAARLKEEQARLERERKERERREEEERKRREEEAKKQAALDEVARKEREEREAREAQEREERRKAEEGRIAELKAAREAEERRVAEQRERAQKFLEERRQAEEAAKAAKTDERQAVRDQRITTQEADRTEKKAIRMDDAANASAAELSRGRGDYGSVGSLVTRWTYRVVDRDKIPLEALRAYLNPDHVDAAVTRFMQAHRPELGQGRDETLLPGVIFEQITETRVA